MTKIRIWIILAALTRLAAAESNDPTLMCEGWTIEAHSDRGRLTIKHERLGTILREVRLNLEADGVALEPKEWSIEIAGPKVAASSSVPERKQGTGEGSGASRLFVRTVTPASTWCFEPTRDRLVISSTAPGAVLSGQAPVSATRGLVRLLDPEGAPVTWQGTGECAGTYGGGYTRNASFLPRENPECMYFSLGQACGSVFHSLFDRKTDTAIDFPGQTRFAGGAIDAEDLAFTLPLPGPGLIRLLPDYYTKVLGLPHYIPFDTSVFDRAPMVWCSWSSYFADATEADCQDVYNNWHGMYMLFDSINANAFLNRMAVYVMPGETMELCAPMSVEEAGRILGPSAIGNARQREEPMIGFGVTTAQARTIVSVVSLTGVAYPLGDVMPELPADRLPLLQRTLPTMPIAPMDLFSRGSDANWACFKYVRSADDYIHNYPEILDLKVAAEAGTYDVVALPNWRSTAVTRF